MTLNRVPKKKQTFKSFWKVQGIRISSAASVVLFVSATLIHQTSPNAGIIAAVLAFVLFAFGNFYLNR